MPVISDGKIPGQMVLTLIFILFVSPYTETGRHGWSGGQEWVGIEGHGGIEGHEDIRMESTGEELGTVNRSSLDVSSSSTIGNVGVVETYLADAIGQTTHCPIHQHLILGLEERRAGCMNE